MTEEQSRKRKIAELKKQLKFYEGALSNPRIASGYHVQQAAKLQAALRTLQTS
jgi:hypothetical protein